MTSPGARGLRELQEEIARSRVQSEQLEARITQQYLAASSYEADAGRMSAAAPPPPAPQQQRSQSMYSRPAVAVSSPQSSVASGAPPRAPAWDDGSLLPSSSAVIGATRRGGGDDGGSVATRSTVRSASRGGDDSPGRVTFRNSMYRSASPSRRVGKDRVVLSNLARAPRFRENKADVPGELCVCETIFVVLGISVVPCWVYAA